MAKKVKRYRGKIKKERKYDVLIRDILSQIRDGSLKPGDRIMSVVDFCKKYSVSQRVVDATIERLREMDIIESRHRIGNFIREFAAEKVANLEPANAKTIEPVTDSERQFHDLRDFYVPKNMRTSLTIYVSDVLPSMLNMWRQILAEYSEKTGIQDIQVMSCLDGHIQDVYPDTHLDVIETTPFLLKCLGPENFVNLDSLDLLQVQESELFPIVQERITECHDLIGAPFSLTLNYIYYNVELGAEQDVTEVSGYDTFQNYIELNKGIDGFLLQKGIHAMVVSEFVDFLIMSGAVVKDGKKQGSGFKVNRRNAEKCFELLYESNFKYAGCYDIFPMFIQKKLLSYRHCSYNVPNLKRRATFKWTAFPLPVEKGIRFPGDITVLGINKRTPFFDESLNLIRYLCSEKIQKRFSSVHANMSVLKNAAFDKSVVKNHPVPKATIEKEIKQSTLLWPKAKHVILQRLAYRLAVNALLSGQSSPEELTEQLGELVGEI